MLFAVSDNAVVFIGCVQIIVTGVIGYLVKRAEMSVGKKVSDVGTQVETNTSLTARSANASKVAAGNAAVAATEAAVTRTNSEDKLNTILEMVNELKAGSSSNLSSKDVVS